MSALTEEEFKARGLALSQDAKVVDSLHSYFVQHCSRLYQVCRRFGLLDRPLGHTLEIGPFFGYTPFLLRPQASAYTVLEGDDPAVEPLKPLYAQHRISARFIDLFESFGPVQGATHTLDYADDSFDLVLCWETMEHFNFNPVKFVRELRRVLKPGGRACITVPNRASFQSLVALISGRFELGGVDHYYHFEDYQSHGKKAFYGFHWREYTRPELQHLFARAGFTIRDSDTFVSFQGGSPHSAARKMARAACILLAGFMRRYGTHVLLVAEKRAAPQIASTN